MNNKKVKAIRRALREELKSSKEGFVARPFPYVNVRGENMLKFKFQYVSLGGRALVKAAKKIYKATGLLPRS